MFDPAFHAPVLDKPAMTAAREDLQLQVRRSGERLDVGDRYDRIIIGGDDPGRHRQAFEIVFCHGIAFEIGVKI